MSIDFTVAAGGVEHAVRVREEDGRLRVAVDGQERTVRLEPRLGSTHFTLWIDDRAVPVVLQGSGAERRVLVFEETYQVRVERRLPVPRRGAAAAGGHTREVVAPIPGLVVSVEVAPGQEVPAGAVLLILEAMKMHSEIRAPAAGRVAAVRVRAGQEVAGGAVLALLEPTA